MTTYQSNMKMDFPEFRRRLRISTDDITTLKVDAIVNAANVSLLGGGGVDGHIHSAAGPGLRQECEKLGPCQPGNSVITGAYALPCKKVIHTVGPVWRGGGEHEEEVLASCYETAMKLAEENNIGSIAFPCISTGLYHYPNFKAAQVALAVIHRYIQNGYDGQVIFCCHTNADITSYQRVLKTWSGKANQSDTATIGV